jgi:hypothetical protein
MIEVAAFGTVAKLIFSGVVILGYSLVKVLSRFLNFFSDLWQVRQLKRRSVFLDQFMEVNFIKMERTISKLKPILRKMVGLVN